MENMCIFLATLAVGYFLFEIVLLITRTITVKKTVKRKRIKKDNQLKFKALCEYHVYDYEPENYVDFLVTSEKYSLSNAIREAEKVFPTFKEKMKEKLFVELYKK